MSAEYPAASWVPIPGFGFPTGSHDGNHPKWIILHGTSSTGATAQNIANYFAGDNQNGTHFVIGRDGALIQMVKLADAAYGNGGPTAAELAQHKYASFWQPEIHAGVNLNTVTVSIEHCKDAGNQQPLTPAQQDASFKLVAWLCQRLNIPARGADANGGITGHYSINGIERVNCPGPYPWTELWAYLKGGPMVPTGWSDDGTTLTAPNGVPVVGGFRTQILGMAWPASNYPLEAEHPQSPLEASNPALGDGVQQVFRLGVLEYTTAKGVFVGWVGQEFLKVREELAAALATPPVPPPAPAPEPSKADLAIAALKEAMNA